MGNKVPTTKSTKCRDSVAAFYELQVVQHCNKDVVRHPRNEHICYLAQHRFSTWNRLVRDGHIEFVEQEIQESEHGPPSPPGDEPHDWMKRVINHAKEDAITNFKKCEAVPHLPRLFRDD